MDYTVTLPSNITTIHQVAQFMHDLGRDYGYPVYANFQGVYLVASGPNDSLVQQYQAKAQLKGLTWRTS